MWHAQSAAEGQLAADQSQTNEQLEALHLECNTIRDATTKAVTKRDASRRAYLKLQMASLTNMATSAAKATLREWCTKAETEVARLQKENAILTSVNVEQSQLLDDQELAAKVKKEATVTLGPMPFPPLSRVGSGLATQASHQLWGRNEWTKHATSVTPPCGGARHCGVLG